MMMTSLDNKSYLFDDLEQIRLRDLSDYGSGRNDEQRKYLRTYYQTKIPISLEVRDEKGEFFQPSTFLLNESFTGLSLLVVTSIPLSKNQLCRVKVNPAGWVSARIVWSHFMTEDCQEIGLCYRF